MKYEWTPPYIFFCSYRVLELFYHNVEAPHDTKCSKIVETFKFWKTEILPEAVFQSYYVKKVFLKILQNSQETPSAREPLFK